MIENLKPLYNAILAPVARVCSRLHIHPNVITITGLVLSVVAGYFCATGRWPAAALIVFLGSCMDGLDGLVARQTGGKTVFGAVLDSTCDRITEMAWLFGIFIFFLHKPVYGIADSSLAFLAMAGSFMVSYVRARSEGAGIACTKGLLQRPERIVIITGCLLLGPASMVWGLGVLCIAAWTTVVQRIVVTYRAEQGR
jgi:phosphatidylglycerophosphate synthase